MYKNICSYFLLFFPNFVSHFRRIFFDIIRRCFKLFPFFDHLYFDYNNFLRVINWIIRVINCFHFCSPLFSYFPFYILKNYTKLFLYQHFLLSLFYYFRFTFLFIIIIIILFLFLIILSLIIVIIFLILIILSLIIVILFIFLIIVISFLSLIIIILFLFLIIVISFLSLIIVIIFFFLIIII